MDYNSTLNSIRDYSNTRNIIGKELKNAESKRQRVEFLQMEKTNNEAKILANKSSVELNAATNIILNNASKAIRDVARTHFEKIVTDALQFVTQDNTIKFTIEESGTRVKPSYEFYVETVVDGNISKQKPEDACGGGFIDIISVTLKYAYWQIFKNPEIKNSSSILDEPGKMISEQMSIKFAEYIKFLGKHFDKQTIMITHNENLASVADKMFYVSKNRNGISEVKDNTSAMITLDLEDFLSNIESEND